MDSERSQVRDELRDVSATGRERPWKAKKEANTYLARAYDEISTSKAERLRECATVLSFNVGSDGNMRLHTMSSCRVRLCPMCAWRRSLKIFSNVSKIMDGMTTERKYGFVFLTLTVSNCEGDKLSKTIDGMMDGWKRLVERKAFRDAVKGFYRGLEVTHNVRPRSKGYNTYHPHFHCILAVDTAYFSGKNYIKQDDWVKMWRDSMRLDYDPIVDVRRVKGDTAKAVAEVAKYSVKDGDYIIPQNWELTVETVGLLDGALANRRLMAYGGKMREWHRRLNLQDEMSGNLVNVDGEEETETIDLKLLTYVWNTGYNQYFRVK